MFFPCIHNTLRLPSPLAHRHPLLRMLPARWRDFPREDPSPHALPEAGRHPEEDRVRPADIPAHGDDS